MLARHLPFLRPPPASLPTRLPHFASPPLQEETCYVQVTGMVTADVLENDQEYDDVSFWGFVHSPFECVIV